MPISAPDGSIIGWFRNNLTYGFIGWKRQPGVTDTPNGRDTALSFGPQRVIGLSIPPGGTWRDGAGQYTLLLSGKDNIVPVWWDIDDPETGAAAKQEMLAMISDFNIPTEATFEVESFRMVENPNADPRKPWEKFVKQPVRRVGVKGCLRFLTEVSKAAEDLMNGRIDVGEIAQAQTRIEKAAERATTAEKKAAELQAKLDASTRLLDALRTKEAQNEAAKTASVEHAARTEKKPSAGK